MEKRRKVGFTTKLLSNHYYLNEVPVEGKTTSKFNWRIAFYDQYVSPNYQNRKLHNTP